MKKLIRVLDTVLAVFVIAALIIFEIAVSVFEIALSIYSAIAVVVRAAKGLLRRPKSEPTKLDYADRISELMESEMKKSESELVKSYPHLHLQRSILEKHAEMISKENLPYTPSPVNQDDSNVDDLAKQEWNPSTWKVTARFVPITEGKPVKKSKAKKKPKKSKVKLKKPAKKLKKSKKGKK